MPFKIVSRLDASQMKAAPEHQITANDFEDGWSNFEARFSLDHPVRTLHCDPMMVTWDGPNSLTALVSVIDQEEHAMVAVYHGLRGDTIVHGFRAIHMLNNTISKSLWDEDSLPSHELLYGGSLKEIKKEDNWGELQMNYFDRVRVLRAGRLNVTPDMLIAAHDPKAVTFPWKSELKVMYVQNKNLLANDELFKLVITNYSMYHREYPGVDRGYNGPNGFRHSVCFHTQRSYDEGSTWRDMLDEGSHTLPYQYRGTDLGHLCPPRCKRIDEAGRA